MSVLDEFIDFLDKHKAIGLAMAFIIGVAATKLVTAIVADLIMPVIVVLTPAGNWQQAVWQVGPVGFLVGDFIGALFDFILVTAVIFMPIVYIARKDAKRDREASARP